MPVLFNPKKINGLFYIPSGATKSESAAFSYSQSSYRVDESNPTPTITGDTGGTFTATPEGLTLNSSTGEITLSSSVINSYTVTYTLPSGTFESRNLGIEAAAFASTQSFSFDGVDDYFDCGQNTSFDTGDLSVSIWVNTSNTRTSTDYVFSNSGSSGIAGFDITINRYGSVQTKRNTRTKDANTGFNVVGLTLNTWHHIAFTYEESTNTLKQYFDGQLTETVVGSTSTNSASIKLSIGSYNGISDFYLGKVDEAAIWNSTLTSSAVTEIYNSGVPNDLDELTNASDPTVWYRMGE